MTSPMGENFAHAMLPASCCRHVVSIRQTPAMDGIHSEPSYERRFGEKKWMIKQITLQQDSFTTLKWSLSKRQGC